jgi:hypothetical protein
MCLTAIGKPTRAIYNKTVYKVLKQRYMSSQVITPYQYVVVNKGDQLTAPFFSNGYGDKKKVVRYTEVHQGVHAYTELKDAIDKCNVVGYGSSGCGAIVVEATIPRFTQFVEGNNGDIASLKLRLGKVVYVKGETAAAKIYDKDYEKENEEKGSEENQSETTEESGTTQKTSQATTSTSPGQPS